MSKKRTNGEGSIHKRADGRWEARITLGFNPKTGQQERKSVYANTAKAASMKLADMRASRDQGKPVTPSKLLLKDWLNIWIADYSVDKKYGTIKGYRSSFRNHIIPALGDCRLGEISPLMVQAFYNDLSRPNEDGKALSPKTVRNIHIALSAAMSQAVENELIRRNPCSKAKLPAEHKTEISPLSDPQINAFLEKAPFYGIYGSLLTVILFTGLREGEALGLTWDCVNFQNGTLHINKQLQRRRQSDGGTQFAPPKNNKPRVLKPGTFVMSILKARYAEQIMQSKLAGDAWEAWHSEEEHRKALVFTNEVGHFFTPKRVYLHFKKLAEEIGAPDARVHDLRHTYAVICLQSGVDMKTLQENLGHASFAFTMDRYGHVSTRMREECASKIDRYVDDMIGPKSA